MKTVNRRIFTGALVGASAAMFLPKASAQESPDWWLFTMTGAAGQFLTQFNQDLQNGADPVLMDWLTFRSAALAIRGFEREFGFDHEMELRYGIDPDCTWACDVAYAEGGWDQFHALTSLGFSILDADFNAAWCVRFNKEPSWDYGNRTYQDSGTWINGTGPYSSRVPTLTGWTETPPKPAYNCEGIDMSIQYPWYGEFGNPYIPTLPTEKRPNPIAMIELPDKCTFLKLALGAAVIVNTVMKGTQADKKFPLYGAAVDAITGALIVSKILYCGV